VGLPDSVLEAIKLSPKYLLPIFIAAAVLLFAPAPLLSQLGVAGLVGAYRMWIGLVCLLSGVLLLSHLLFSASDWLSDKVSTRRFKAQGLKYLTSLTPPEKRLLGFYIAHNTRSQNLELESGVANGLVHQGVIYRASNVGRALSGFAHNIQPWAWDALQAQPSLLEPELGELRQQVSARRPRGY
jgi:hypothetical protein